MEKTDVSIFVSSLKKSYKDKEILKDVTFSVPTGTIYALLGSNGAGKTTTIRILTTQIRPDGGTAHIQGFDVAKEPEKVHRVRPGREPDGNREPSPHGTSAPSGSPREISGPAPGIF